MISITKPLNGLAPLVVGLVLFAQLDFIYSSASPKPLSLGKTSAYNQGSEPGLGQASHIHAHVKKISEQPIPAPTPSMSLGIMNQAGKARAWGKRVPAPKLAETKQTIGSPTLIPSPSSIEAPPTQTSRSPSPSPGSDPKAEAEQTPVSSLTPPSPSYTKPQSKQISGSPPIQAPTPSVGIPSSGHMMGDSPTTPPPSPKIPIRQAGNDQGPSQVGPTGWFVQWSCELPPHECKWPSMVYPIGSGWPTIAAMPGPSPNVIASGGATGFAYPSPPFYPRLYYYYH